MTFLWPEVLWLLLLVPALVAAYVAAAAAEEAGAVRYANLGLVKAAIGPGAAVPAPRAAGSCSCWR